MNTVSLRLLESGLLAQWTTVYASKQRRCEDEIASHNVLVLEQYRGIIYVLLIACGVACLAFVAELVLYKLVSMFTKEGKVTISGGPNYRDNRQSPRLELISFKKVHV